MPSAAPSLQLLHRFAEVFENPAVGEFDLAACRQGRDEPWNAVHKQARMAFAFAHEACLLQTDGRLARRDIEKKPFRVSGEIEPQ